MVTNPISGAPETERTFERILRRAVLVVLTPFLIVGALSSYRAYFQVYRLDLRVDGPRLGAGSSARADVVCSGRVPVTLVLELVQEARAETLGAKVIPNRPDPFFDPRTVKAELSVMVRPETLARFKPGIALVRATALGRSQWLRVPPPLVRQAQVVIAASSSKE